MNVKDIRRQNLRVLARSVGGVSKLAEYLEKSQSQISHLIGTNPVKNIGDKFAAHAESVFNKPYGWLDQMHLAEEEAIYQVTAIVNQAHYKVPVLTWLEAQQYFLDKKTIKKNPSQCVVTHIPLSSQAIALRVEGDSMEVSHGPSFAAGSIIVLDPTLTAQNGSYVVAKQNMQSPLVFKQLIIDGARHYLKPLNQRYPLTDISPQTTICAVVRLMLLEFK